MLWRTEEEREKIDERAGEPSQRTKQGEQEERLHHHQEEERYKVSHGEEWKFPENDA